MTFWLIIGVVGIPLIGIALFGRHLWRLVEIPLEAAESIQFVGPANHIKGLEGVGGKLAVTDRHLIFRSHWVNVQRHTLKLPLALVSAIEPVRMLGIADTGLRVHLADGQQELFVVADRPRWIELLSKHGRGVLPVAPPAQDIASARKAVVIR
ncbi:MAG TPA: hypothetical protein VF454_05070 [Gemmatimonadales bacterium]